MIIFHSLKLIYFTILDLKKSNNNKSVYVRPFNLIHENTLKQKFIEFALETPSIEFLRN